MKNKFNSGDGLPLNKTLKLYNMIIVARYVFYDGNKHTNFFKMNVCIN